MSHTISVTSGHFIDGAWVTGGGPSLESTNPATGEVCWSGRAATAEEVDYAFTAARGALPAWTGLPLSHRIALCEAFAEQLRDNRDALARTISIETGKPWWESLTEVDAMIGKVPVSIEALRERRAETDVKLQDVHACTRYKPHGVVAVFGPFNLPGHLPNGHVVPALLAGNTVVFKPSEQAPSVGAHVLALWRKAGVPNGVINLVQGGRDTGRAIVQHRELDGLFFTGSYATGCAINQALADQPGRILALEMGGNNPLVVHDVTDVDAAAYYSVLSAFITAGQRCTCARRLIVPTGDAGDHFLDRLIAMAALLRIGAWDAEPVPFMGPLISAASAQRVLDAQQALVRAGGKTLLHMQRHHGHDAMLTPGIIDVTNVAQRKDEEVFGPLLQVIRTADFDAAIAEANNTSFGLSAALLSERAELFDQFFRHIRAGVVNWNRQTTGASGRLPFGGVGNSGNHRPSGYFAADYCAYPVASLQREQLTMPEQPLPGIDV